jgi:hypothetical protein
MERQGFTGGLYQNRCSDFHKDGVNLPEAGDGARGRGG